MGTRDALAKALYGRLFDKIVALINESLSRAGPGAHHIAILDVSAQGMQQSSVRG